MNNKSWSCAVCGYVHNGETPPGCCPVCGATPDLFEPLVIQSTLPAKGTNLRYRCLNCEYIHEGTIPPARCPVCGVDGDQFEPAAEQVPVLSHSGASRSIVVIGSGIAGLSAAEAARTSDSTAKITMLTRDMESPYYRLNLTRYLTGEISADDLPVHPDKWYAERGIDLLRGVEVTSIEPGVRMLRCRGGDDIGYDRLILAMGAHPFVPPLPGVNRRGVSSLRTFRDAELILESCSPGTSCVVVGGGVLGLETAAALAKRNVQITVIEGFEWLLPRQLNRKGGARLAEQAGQLGIRLILNGRITAFDGDERVRSVLLETGESVAADTVIVAAGVRCNSYLARLAGLETREGVVVDNMLRSSDPNIYAAGDLAEHQGVVYGAWAPSQFQGSIAGMNAAGNEASFAGIPRSNILKVLEMDMFSIGVVHPDDASYRVFEHDGTHYDLFVFRDSHLVGAILVGDATIAPAVKKLIESQASCAEMLSGETDAAGVRRRIAGL